MLANTRKSAKLKLLDFQYSQLFDKAQLFDRNTQHHLYYLKQDDLLRTNKKVDYNYLRVCI